MKRFKIFLMLLIATLGLFSCSSDDDDERIIIDPVEKMSGTFIVNQGNYYSHIVSSVDFIPEDNDTVFNKIFLSENGITPGNTLQAGIVHDNYIYLIAYESNVMFVANADNLKLQSSVMIESPRALAADDNYVYVSNFTGYVTRYDVKSQTIKDSVKVGSNPEEMAIANGYLYVTNSDGLNYMGGYSNGKSVSKVRLSDFKVEKTIPVGLNPSRACADADGNVYIIANGDYATVPSMIQKIDSQDNVSDVAEASYMCTDGETLYGVLVKTEDWVTYDNDYFKIDLHTGKRTDDIFKKCVDYPTNIGINPKTKHVFVTSCHNIAGMIDYNGAGYVNEYDNSGNLIKSYSTGVYPGSMFFTK